MRQDFEGGVYWDKLAETWRHFEGGRISRCSEISRKYGVPYNVLNLIQCMKKKIILILKNVRFSDKGRQSLHM